MVTIELQDHEVNILLGALGQLPYTQSAPVISNIVKQLPKPVSEIKE